MYASVIVEIGVKNVDKLFTYLVPEFMQKDIKVGSRVRVSFGRVLLEGFVLKLSNIPPCCEYELKEIIELIDKVPILNEEMMFLGEKLQEYTLCSKICAYQVMLPKALKASVKTNIKKKMIRYAVLSKDDDYISCYINECKSEKQIMYLKKLLMDRILRVCLLYTS